MLAVMLHEDLLERLRKMNREAELGGGVKKIEEQHAKGKLTARERLDILLDPGSFVEIDKFAVHRATEFGMAERRYLGDGVVTGYGKIDGRTVFVFSHDFTVMGGSLGEVFGKKVCKIMDLALKTGAPVIGLNDSGGARIQEGIASLAAYSEIFFRNTLASGVIPQISAIMGPCAGGAVYSPAMTDFIFMVEKTATMFVTGPDVVKAALGQEVSFEELGGAHVHAEISGVAHFTAADDEECLMMIRRLLSYLPSNNSELPPRVEPQDRPDRRLDGIESIVPEDPYKPYDMKQIILEVLDDGDFMEVHAGWAQNIIVGFGRLDGNTVGVVANQPLHMAGVLDINSSDKAARFIRFCDCFNIPIITFVDVPGYMPGIEQEHGGIIRHGSKLLYAYCEATVPKITVNIRKAYGGAYCAMGSKYSRADINLAWPTAEIAVMGPEGAINIIFRKEVASAQDPEAKRRELAAEYRRKFANPYVAAERGLVDEVIEPSETRIKLIKALDMLRDKEEFRPAKKHGNIPL
ncbi:MAG: acyl-CoA carboxylase subunit beta [Aigarchaeota archaeon]|nr:acyl-CoA carboxylase subunit beta [Candidatus Pelearchaeum maunauluense]